MSEPAAGSPVRALVGKDLGGSMIEFSLHLPKGNMARYRATVASIAKREGGTGITVIILSCKRLATVAEGGRGTTNCPEITKITINGHHKVNQLTNGSYHVPPAKRASKVKGKFCYAVIVP